ncbi:MAG TPA: hypothetical protein DEO40_07525 [Treponema sp.]|nr:hypothetical protein [Treponema sp.]HCA20510.1 hypothetical protein [Treponema sp.]
MVIESENSESSISAEAWKFSRQFLEKNTPVVTDVTVAIARAIATAPKEILAEIDKLFFHITSPEKKLYNSGVNFVNIFQSFFI